MKETQKTGARNGHEAGDRKSKSSGTTLKLEDLGITRDQSSKWQKLAEIPEAEF
jgi:hypothetical protein